LAQLIFRSQMILKSQVPLNFRGPTLETTKEVLKERISTRGGSPHVKRDLRSSASEPQFLLISCFFYWLADCPFACSFLEGVWAIRLLFFNSLFKGLVARISLLPLCPFIPVSLFRLPSGSDDFFFQYFCLLQSLILAEYECQTLDRQQFWFPRLSNVIYLKKQ